MSAAADLKVPLQRQRTNTWWSETAGPRPTPILRALPVYISVRGYYAHRVRSGNFHNEEERYGRNRLSFSLWCGQNGYVYSAGRGRPRAGGSLYAVPPDENPICGTCEGRAVGAGQPSLAFLLQQHALIYSPRAGAR